MAYAYHRDARRTVKDLSSPPEGAALRLFQALYRAGADGVSRDDLQRAIGSTDTHNLGGMIYYLRHSRGIAINCTGWRPGWLPRPGRYYLAPWGSGPA